jgi:hypothetical protein
MSEKLLICEQMAAVRNRGLVNASELGEEVERLSDWREHVRAYPVPLVLGAAALGFWIVPGRVRKKRVDKSGSSHSARAETIQEERTKTAGVAGIGGAAMGFVGSLIGNAVRAYIAEQLHSLMQGKNDHAPQDQRKASTYRH